MSDVRVKKMVTGFNHNIKHKGQVFHVQTEDSGVDTPHIITHLFVGGNILASQKSSYADIVHADNLEGTVRTMMEEQHKDMLRSLISGAYDEVIARYSNRSWQPGVVDDGSSAGAAGQVAPVAVEPSKQGPPVPPSAPPRSVSEELFRPAPPAPAPATPLRAMEVQPHPRDAVDTIFGEDLISERSLDEVILSYLAEDSDEP